MTKLPPYKRKGLSALFQPIWVYSPILLDTELTIEQAIQKLESIALIVDEKNIQDSENLEEWFRTFSQNEKLKYCATVSGKEFKLYAWMRNQVLSPVMAGKFIETQDGLRINIEVIDVNIPIYFLFQFFALCLIFLPLILLLAGQPTTNSEMASVFGIAIFLGIFIVIRIIALDHASFFENLYIEKHHPSKSI